MATIIKKELQEGGTSYKIQCKFKNPLTNKYTNKSITWKKPLGMSDFVANREVKKVAYEYELQLKKEEQGLLDKDYNIIFKEYSQKWLERIKNTCSVTYYETAKKIISQVNEEFGAVKLKEITPVIIQNYIDKVSSGKVITKRAKLKGDLQLYLRANLISLKRMTEMTGVSDNSYQSANRGNYIHYETAKKICDGLGIKYNNYFETIEDIKDYAKETIVRHKRILSAVLATAKRLRLIEHNFASSEYLNPVTGIKNEVLILNDIEAKKLMKILENEPNIRWKTAIMTVLLMGIRRAELAGLEWEDIDFENKTMTIQRASYSVAGYGTITKTPKTENSIRTISIPEKLLNQLKEYKAWWDHRKELLAFAWKDAKRLFTNDDGKVMNPSSFRAWLNKLLMKNGLPQVSLHSLRHTNITLQLIAGVDIKTVAVRAGHARASTTSDFYSHFVRSSDIKASNTINDIFRKNNVEAD